MTRYLFCCKFTGKIQFFPDKRTLKWCWAHDWISSKDHRVGLSYFEESKTKLIVYADAEYLSDPHKARSQTRYLFSCGGTIISWRSIKQMLLRRNKSPPWSKSKVRLIEINTTPYSGNVWAFFEKEYTNHNVQRFETSSQEIKWCFNQGSIIHVALFFPWPRFFSYCVFLARFLMRQQIVRIKRYVYSFLLH